MAKAKLTMLEARKIRGDAQRKKWRERRLRALELRKQDFSFSAIGKEMGVSRSQAQRLVILGRREQAKNG